MSELRIERYRGQAIAEAIPDLAALRMEVFREFPYLYQGNMVYEQTYLGRYSKDSDSLVVMLYDDNQAVGATTGMPLADEAEEIRAPFAKAGYDLRPVFYFGESLLLPAYRGQGWGKRFFIEREAHARGLGDIETVCFCAVQRPADHPARPADYRGLESFWERLGYCRRPELKAYMRWHDIGENEETAKAMVFWTKALNDE